MNKTLIKQCHDNTHSIGRILRNANFLKDKSISEERFNKCIENIINSALECRNQMDILYNEFKNL